MIDKEVLREVVDRHLEGSGCFPVEITVSPANDITVEIDSLEPVDIDRCISLTRAIEEAFDRDVEDYSLEVGSAGLTSPLKDPRQYRKYVGEELEVLSDDGKKYKGVLEECGDETFTIVCREKVKREGSKRPVEEQVSRTFPYGGVKYTKYILQL